MSLLVGICTGCGRTDREECPECMGETFCNVGAHWMCFCGAHSNSCPRCKGEGCYGPGETWQERTLCEECNGTGEKRP